MKGLYSCILFLGLTLTANAQIASINNGDWATPSNWDCGCVPDASSGQEISVLHDMTISSDIQLNWVSIENGGLVVIDAGVVATFIEDFTNTPLNIASGGKLINNGTLDLASLVFVVESSVYGTVQNSGDIQIFDPSLLHFYDGSVYRHVFSSGGDIPTALWEKNSTVEINSLSSANPLPPNNLNQAFGNFTWDTPNFGTSTFPYVFSLGGALTNVQGNLTFVSTQSKPVHFDYQTSGYNLTVGEDIIVTGGTVFFARELTSITTITAKNFQMSGGTVQLGTNNNFGIDLRISGNFTKTIGNLGSGAGSGIRRIIFNGSGSPAQLYSVNTFVPSTNLSFIIEPNAVVDLGENPMVTTSTSGAFTLQGTVILRSTNSAGAIAGNIPIINRSFTSGSTIIYDGSSPQFIGSSHPDPAAYPGVHTTIDNDVTISSTASTIAVGGTLNLSGGNLTIGDNKTLVLHGALTRTNGHTIVISSLSSITVAGSGAFGTLYTSGSTTINNLSLQRGSQTVILGTDLTINGTLDQTAGNLNYSGRQLTIANNYSLGSPGGNLTGDAASTLIVTGIGTVATLPLNGSIGILEINRESGAANTTSVTVVDELRLLGGVFAGSGAVTLTPGILVTRGDGSTTKSFTVSTYDLTYENGAPIETGNELIPTAVNNLTISGNNSVTLHPDNVSTLTINGTLTLENGEFISNGKPIFLEGNFVSNATGTFDNSIVTFAGNTTLSGGTTITLSDVEVQAGATLNLGTSVNLEIAGDFTVQSGAIMAGGTSTTTFTGTTAMVLPDVTTSPRFHNLSIAPNSSLAISCTSCGTENNRPALELTGLWNSNTSGAVFTPAANTSVRLVGTANQNIVIREDAPVHSFANLEVAGSSNATLITTLRVLNDLSLEGTKLLSTGTGNETIYVGGDFILDGGAFNPFNGTVIFNGSGAQTISRFSGTGAPTFHNITLEQTGGSFRVQTDVNLRNIFTITSAGLVVDFDGGTTTTGNAIFTLLSQASQTASIATIPDPSIVFGNVTVQRYMSGNEGKIFRYISSPVSGARVVDLQGEIPVTGSFTGSSWTAPTDCAGCAPCTDCTSNLQTMFRLNETKVGSPINYRYEDFPQNANTETFEVGRGYSVYVREDVDPTTWNLRGTVTKGQQSLPVTYSGSSGDDGWNLVGNPYPSTIDWLIGDGASSWTRTNIDPTIYLWDESIENYATFNRSLGAEGTGTFGGSRYISSGQAFWIRTTGSSPALVAREGIKANQPATEFLRISPISDILRMTLEVEGRQRDQAVIVTNIDGATNNYDASLDSYKFYGPINLYTITEDERSLAINAMGSMGCSKEIQMGFSGATAGSYAIRFSEFSNMIQDADLYLIDKYKGESFALDGGNAVYEFQVSDDSASFDLNRFSLLFSKAPIDTKLLTQAEDVCVGMDAKVDLLSSQKDIGYYITLNGTTVSEEIVGTGGSLSLIVQGDKIGTGENTLMIMARPLGCTAVPLENGVTINKEPVPVVSKVENGISCNGGSVSLKAFGAPSGAVYNWYESIDATEAIATETSGVLDIANPHKTSTYYVSISSALGCESERIEVKAEVNIFADAMINVVDDKLVSNHSSGNQWYLGGEKIDGATGMEFKPAESGVYKLDVTVGMCVSSTEMNFVVTGIDDPSLVGVDVYPNPTTDVIKVRVNSSNDVSINMYNSLGVKVISAMPLTQTGANSRSVEVDLSSGVSGFYLIEILDGKSIKWKKILKK